MPLGVVLHVAMSFVPFPWPVWDVERRDPLVLLIAVVHGFRMPLFLLLSGCFTTHVFSRRGLASLLEQRCMRLFPPLVIATLVTPRTNAIVAATRRCTMPPISAGMWRPGS